LFHWTNQTRAHTLTLVGSTKNDIGEAGNQFTTAQETTCLP